MFSPRPGGTSYPFARHWRVPSVAAAALLAVGSVAVAAGVVTAPSAAAGPGLQRGMQARNRSAAPVVLPQPVHPVLPTGKGMWTWQVARTENGDPRRVVERAKAHGISHVYVRTGDSNDGFYAGPFLDRLLPVAHAAGLQVLAWDFPRLIDPLADAARSVAAIAHVAPGGHRVDGFVADIETASEGTVATAERATAYANALREAVGEDYPLIACVPRPSIKTQARFPFAAVVARFSAIAPMVYWLNREPVGDLLGTMAFFAPFGKPVLPIGQAYDGAAEGGRPGVPPPAELQAFLETAERTGARAVSFWSWQHADAAAWTAVARAPQFATPASAPIGAAGPLPPAPGSAESVTAHVAAVVASSVASLGVG